MNLIEEIQKILDEKYPALCAEAKGKIGVEGGVWIYVLMGTSKWLNIVSDTDAAVKGCLEDLKVLVDNSLEEISQNEKKI